MNILITGGCGYIGSHMVRMAAKRKGYNVTVLDTMENGVKASVPADTEIIVGNVADEEILTKIFETKKIDAVVHFAAYLRVEESVQFPIKYMQNNLIGPLKMLQMMEKYHVKNCVFSSSAATYGYPTVVPIPEDHAKNPVSPYGLSKWCFEQLLSIFDRQDKIRSISLRYFNAAGADLSGNFGEAHKVETHIIPKVISTALGRQDSFTLFGTDYETRDGSCERDYVHLEDLCEAHFLSLDALLNGHATTAYNVATGIGVTNQELVQGVKKLSGKDFKVEQKPRRPGDPNILVADPTRIKKELGWNPQYSDLTTILKTAWTWHSTHPQGYNQ